jgi:hypothetical protein
VAEKAAWSNRWNALIFIKTLLRLERLVRQGGQSR